MTVPGPMNAALITDQKSTETSRFMWSEEDTAVPGTWWQIPTCYILLNGDPHSVTMHL